MSHQCDLGKFPPTSSSIRKHILPAWLQCHLWLHASFIEDISRDPLKCGYMFNDEDPLAPIVNQYLALHKCCKVFKVITGRTRCTKNYVYIHYLCIYIHIYICVKIDNTQAIIIVMQNQEIYMIFRTELKFRFVLK